MLHAVCSFSWQVEINIPKRQFMELTKILNIQVERTITSDEYLTLSAQKEKITSYKMVLVLLLLPSNMENMIL